MRLIGGGEAGHRCGNMVVPRDDHKLYLQLAQPGYPVLNSYQLASAAVPDEVRRLPPRRLVLSNHRQHRNFKQ